MTGSTKTLGPQSNVSPSSLSEPWEVKNGARQKSPRSLLKLTSQERTEALVAFNE